MIHERGMPITVILEIQENSLPVMVLPEPKILFQTDSRLSFGFGSGLRKYS